MKIWVAICKVLEYIWLVLAGLLILVDIAGVWMKRGLFWSSRTAQSV